ncbi:hypothetical protein D8T91_21805 [Salmonella enterica]|nr:hypothetical protein [Salmonella enterica]
MRGKNDEQTTEIRHGEPWLTRQGWSWRVLPTIWLSTSLGLSLMGVATSALGEEMSVLNIKNGGSGELRYGPGYPEVSMSGQATWFTIIMTPHEGSGEPVNTDYETYVCSASTKARITLSNVPLKYIADIGAASCYNERTVRSTDTASEKDAMRIAAVIEKYTGSPAPTSYIMRSMRAALGAGPVSYPNGPDQSWATMQFPLIREPYNTINGALNSTPDREPGAKNEIYFNTDDPTQDCSPPSSNKYITCLSLRTSYITLRQRRE